MVDYGGWTEDEPVINIPRGYTKRLIFVPTENNPGRRNESTPHLKYKDKVEELKRSDSWCSRKSLSLRRLGRWRCYPPHCRDPNRHPRSSHFESTPFGEHLERDFATKHSLAIHPFLMFSSCKISGIATVGGLHALRACSGSF